MAAPSAAAWNSAPTRRSGQYASGASSRTTSAVPSSSEPCASRTPTVTATSATDSVATSSRTAEDAKAMPEGPQRGDAVAVGDLGDAADCARARRCATSVGSPRTTSRKCPDSASIARHCSAARSRVASPTSAPKTGTRGSVASTMSALSRSWVAIATTASGGSTAASTRAGT